MADKQFKTILWTIVIIFLLVSSAGIFFVIFFNVPGKGGKGVKIAVLDSGINLNVNFYGIKTSSELRDAVIASKSFVTTEYGFDSNASIVDDTASYHGTVIALTIAGRSEDIGIAHESKLIIGRCVDKDGQATYAALYAAFQWAVYEADADIVSISLGGSVLYNNTIVEAINQASRENGVLTVISAGNNGDGTGFTTSTIDGPGDALEAITVGAMTATGIAEYSSLGPLRDHSIKPDVVDSGFSINAVGTSFAAPKVAAKAAVIKSWAESLGLKTNPGLLKAALMTSAKINERYIEYYGGAGLPDIEEAKKVITDAQKVNNLPILFYVLPRTLPFGITNVFRGDTWSFPLTIISSLEQEFTFTRIPQSGDSIVSIAPSLTLNQSNLVSCKFIIPDDYPPVYHREIIEINTNYDLTLQVNISVTIKDPLVRIGFDVYHNVWEYDHLLGQFLEMREHLLDEGVALIEFRSPDNYTTLTDYDALILADPNTYGIRLNATHEPESFFIPFSDTTIQNIVDYVNTGHGLFVVSNQFDSAEINETNRLLSNFNITIAEPTVPIEITQINGNYNIVEISNLSAIHPVTNGVGSIDFLGASLNITGANAEGIAWGITNVTIGSESFEQWRPVVAAFQSPNSSAGRVVITGSNFMIDNYGINNRYEAADNLLFLFQTIEWITNTSFISSPNIAPSFKINTLIPVVDFTTQIYSNHPFLPSELQPQRTFNTSLLIAITKKEKLE